MKALTQERKINEIVSYFKLSDAYIKRRAFDPTKIINPENSFEMVSEKSDTYVDPNFTVVENEIEDGGTKIILISAAGATGKTALTERLSEDLNIPIFDLAKHPPVGKYSLIGLFSKILGPHGYSEYVQNIRNGQAALIIDALDEGKIKTTEEGFNAFLDDLIDISNSAAGISFILSGRSQVVDHTWLYLAENNIKSSLLRISPFTIKQAEEFIDLHITEAKYNQPYIQVRDFIIQSIKGFFTTTSKAKREDYNAFIGYAPVLKSIVTLLEEEQNYVSLHERLKSSDNKGLALVIDIVEEIMARERDMKVRNQVLPTLLQNRPVDATKEVMENAYDTLEQCARLLAKQLEQKIYLKVCSDAATNDLYNDKIDQWLDEHPFLSNGKIQNSVFESYILSVLINDGNYEKLVDEYLNKHYKAAFMLFFIYEEIKDSDVIPVKYIPYLYDSVKSLDNTQFKSFLSIDADEPEDGTKSQPCEIEIQILTPEDVKIYQYECQLERGESINLNGILNGVFIDAPVTVDLTGPKVILGPPVDIRCAKLVISCDEISLEKGLLDNGFISRAQGRDPDQALYVVNLENSSRDIIFDCQQFEIDYARSSNPIITNYLGADHRFIIYTKDRPAHPFGTYYDAEGCTYSFSEDTMEKYLRFRRIVTTLRSHSKGVLARYKGKIEHRRILKNATGAAILLALIEKGILYSDQNFYYWAPEPADQYLGIDYKGISQMKITPKLDEFLQSINAK